MTTIESILDKLTPECIESMKKIHFIADLHFCHPKIVNICNRPVPLIEGLDISIPEQKVRINELHTDWLIREVYNKYIGKRDDVYILGDVSMASRIETEKIIDKLNGNKYLILGNHDKNLVHSTRFSQITQKKNFVFSQYGLNIHIVLDHEPIASWERKIHDSFHLYGHVHGKFKSLSPEIKKFMGLSWDVGIDNKENYIGFDNQEHNNWCKPTNLYEVIQIIAWKSKILNA